MSSSLSKFISISLLAGLYLSFGGVPAYAAKLSGSADLGYTASSGSSRTSSLNTKLALKYKTGLWTHKVRLTALSASKSSQTTAGRYAGDAKSKYNFSPHNYAFAQIQYIKDLFAGVRQNASETVGYGRRLLHGNGQALDAEIGAGFSQTQEQKPSLARHHNAIAQLGLHYRYTINKTSRLEQRLTVQSGKFNTFMESVTGLRVAINSHLGVQLSYTVDHNSRVPAGLAKTDTYTSVALAYQFENGG